MVDEKQVGPGHPHPPLKESPGSYAAGTAPSKKTEAQLARERVNSDSGKVGVDPSAKHVRADGVENAPPPGPPAENRAMTGNLGAGAGAPGTTEGPGATSPAQGRSGATAAPTRGAGSAGEGNATVGRSSTTGTGSRK